MTNYEKIKKIIEAGHIAQAYDKERDSYCLFTSLYGVSRVRHSDFFCSPSHCIKVLGGFSSPRKWIDDERVITVYQPPLHYYKPGDFVEALGTIFDKTRKHLKIGGKYKVLEDVGDFVIIEGDLFASAHRVSHRNIAPRIHDEEPKKDDMIGKELTVTMDGKEYKVKVIG